MVDDHLQAPHLTLDAGPGDNAYDVLLQVAKDQGLDSLNEALEYVVKEWLVLSARIAVGE